MKRAYINGILLDGTQQMEPQAHKVLLCEDGSHRLIRRAETPRDYFATLDFLPFMKPLLGEYNDD